MANPGRRKFFQEARAEAAGDGFRLLLDGKPVKTPRGRVLIVPTAALAEALAAEWNALEAVVDPARLPLTRLVNTALDGLAQSRALVLQDLARYAGSDLICYRSLEPDALAQREAAAWDPLIAWARDVLGGDLVVTTGVIHRAQSEDAIDALAASAVALDDFALTALHTATGVTGSLVIALALVHGRVDAAEAWRLSAIDETFQAERWGRDEEAEARAANHQAALQDAARFLRFCAAK
jgi:chaperone required for assembly of F1-ATPase